MKLNKFFLKNIAILLLFYSCETGVKKDLITGLKVINNNLSYEQALIYEDGKRTNVTEFTTGSVLEFHLDGVSGFKEEEGRVFIGAAMTIINQENVEILHYPDLFEEFDKTGVSPIDARQLSLTLKIKSPLEAGHKYIWKARVWDKKGSGEITSEMEISVK